MHERPADDTTRRLLHRTIAGVREDLTALRFNTAVARLITLNNRLTGVAADTGSPREIAEPLVLMIAPFTPHIAEELWARLGHVESLAYAAFPTADPALITADQLEYPVRSTGRCGPGCSCQPTLSRPPCRTRRYNIPASLSCLPVPLHTRSSWYPDGW